VGDASSSPARADPLFVTSKIPRLNGKLSAERPQVRTKGSHWPPTSQSAALDKIKAALDQSTASKSASGILPEDLTKVLNQANDVQRKI
jgi:hypothetical protein